MELPVLTREDKLRFNECIRAAKLLESEGVLVTRGSLPSRWANRGVGLGREAPERCRRVPFGCVSRGRRYSAFSVHLHDTPCPPLVLTGNRRGALDRYTEALAINSGHGSLLQKIAYLRRACAPLDERNTAAEKGASVTVVPPASFPTSTAATAALLPAPAARDADKSGGCDDDDDDDDCVIVTQRCRPGPVAPAPAPARPAVRVDGTDSDEEAASVPLRSIRAMASAPTVTAPVAPLPVIVAQVAGVAAGVAVGVGAPAVAVGVGAPAASSTSLVDGYRCYVDGLAMLPGGFGLPRKLFEKLYGYQRAGIAWMWSLHADAGGGGGGGDKVCGGILADDMGLGAWYVLCGE